MINRRVMVPNIQNIPVRTEDGARIREALIRAHLGPAPQRFWPVWVQVDSPDPALDYWAVWMPDGEVITRAGPKGKSWLFPHPKWWTT